MAYQDVQPPDLFPILSPGKHRNPRTGACFMELASLLAGERWSDHFFTSCSGAEVPDACMSTTAPSSPT
jgi:hypothetical protein